MKIGTKISLLTLVTVVLISVTDFSFAVSYVGLFMFYGSTVNVCLEKGVFCVNPFLLYVFDELLVKRRDIRRK